MTYQAPVDELRFTLEEVAAVGAVKSGGAFAEFSEDLTFAILEEAAKLAGGVLAPLNRTGDLQGCTLKDGVVTTPEGFKDAYAQFVEGGWQGLQFPAEVGGMGLPRALGVAVLEMIQSANMAFGLGPMLTYGAIEALLAHGTQEQRDQYLPKLLTGEWTATMNLTEPQAGSDVGALRTKAEPNPDGSWSISGQKIYITWGEHDCTDNIIHLVLARTPGSPEGTKGISLFIVPKFLDDGTRNAATAIGLEHKLGIHGSPTCTMDYAGAKGWLIGGENAGMRCMFTMMNSARLNVGVQGVGIAERAYQQALAYAKDRKQGKAIEADGPGPHAIIEHPDIQRTLAMMRAKIAASRAICIATAVAADLAEHAEDEEERAAAKRREELLTPVAKAWSTDIGVEVASMGIQIHGGMGFIEETGAAQHLRDARIAPIYEGTNAIQALDLAGRKLSMAGGAAFEELYADIEQTIESCSTSSHPDLPPLAERLEDGLDALKEAAAWLNTSDPADRLSGATPFLTLAGEVIGGWMLCVAAVAVRRRQKENIGDPKFAAERIALANFYAEAVLALSPSRVDDITIGYDMISELGFEAG
ncbi:MAG: acyl-CoA dehydrogenase [Maricaulis sp.]|uniref:acyl-CoA dehydrogenase n=1 Tax=Maricaulis sp. TaxID=1486257 RepID=UPI001AFE4EA9|nr:acyl-CoA dehydrogenase [Maricaulis sp.]MBO6847505.1 acyl-CoA dehydrogenase [Maricaulis sp.]MBO6877075.1 acyl-CoA dehydrogenase [Maricaulis sp.]